jgi:hypothetical protein
MLILANNPTAGFYLQKGMRFVLILLLFLFPDISFSQLDHSIQLETKKGETDSVYHNRESQTIDFYVTLREEGETLWNFRDEDIIIYEYLGGEKKDSLPIYFQRRIQNSVFSEPVYLIKTRSQHNLLGGERQYEIVWFHLGRGNAEDSTIQTLRKNWYNVLTPVPLVASTYSFWDVFVLGSFALILLLLILSELIPFFRKQAFKRKYVRPYHKVREAGESSLHPVTARPIDLNEQVVVKCENPLCGVPLSIWEKKNYECWHYPKQCQGTANIGFRQFFHQMGIFKKLNWLWFGALGGFLAWTLYYLLRSFLPISTWQSEQLYPIYMGAALGISLSSMLAWVEEKGQGRELSYKRIALKVLLGLVASVLVFYLFTLLPANPYLAGLNWLLFCVVLGVILSVNSAITLHRGLLSGFIAGTLSTLVYVLLLVLVPNPEAELPLLATFILAGGILGYIIMQVVSELERIELEVISPPYRRGLQIPLDRWLNAGQKVTLGRSMKSCEVRVKWEDNYVLPEHAELKMQNNKVYITPLGDAEIWVGDGPLKNGRSYRLEGGEIIRLGRHSQTAFKYMQKS